MYKSLNSIAAKAAVSLAVFATLLCGMQRPAMAWTPPSTVKVIVGQSPGGGNEFAFRGVSPILEKNIPNTKFVLEHRPGLDNVVAMNYFAAQEPNGKNILVVVQATGLVAAPVAYKEQLKVNPMTYSFVTALAKSPMAFIVGPDSKFKSVNDLINYARDPKNKLNIGISGSINLLAYSFFVDKIGASPDAVRPIRFNSPTEASVAVSNGSVDVAIVPMSVPKPLIDAKKVTLLAHTGSSKIPGTESAALMKDYIKDFVLEATWSVFLPPNTPANIVYWYSQELIRALDTPAAKTYYANNWATIDKNALGPVGLVNSVNQLRKTWLPIAEQVLSNEK